MVQLSTSSGLHEQAVQGRHKGFIVWDDGPVGSPRNLASEERAVEIVGEGHWG